MGGLVVDALTGCFVCVANEVYAKSIYRKLSDYTKEKVVLKFKNRREIYRILYTKLHDKVSLYS